MKWPYYLVRKVTQQFSLKEKIKILYFITYAEMRRNSEPGDIFFELNGSGDYVEMSKLRAHYLMQTQVM